jgi:succinoglycan biosynthesis protein ExoA
MEENPRFRRGPVIGLQKPSSHPMRASKTSDQGSPAGGKRGEQEGGLSGVDPTVTVLMPVRNEARHLASSLGAVLSQDYARHLMQIVVIDGVSSDQTKAIASGLLKEVQGWNGSEIIDNPRQTAAAGLNTGLARARGQVIVRVDGHCVIPRNYVSTCVRILAATGASVVGGRLEAQGDGIVGQAVAFGQSTWFGAGGASFRMRQVKRHSVDTVPFGAYRREIFETIGNFDEDLVRNQDDEFNLRLTQSGGLIWLEPSLEVKYWCRSTLGSLWMQYFEYGFYKVPVIQKRRAVGAWRALVPPLFVSTLGLSVLPPLLGGRRLGLLASFAYLLSSSVCSLPLIKRDWKATIVLPMVFLAMHAGYGAGFLWGLYRWRSGWTALRTGFIGTVGTRGGGLSEGSLRGAPDPGAV